MFHASIIFLKTRPGWWSSWNILLSWTPAGIQELWPRSMLPMLVFQGQSPRLSAAQRARIVWNEERISMSSLSDVLHALPTANVSIHQTVSFTVRLMDPVHSCKQFFLNGCLIQCHFDVSLGIQDASCSSRFMDARVKNWKSFTRSDAVLKNCKPNVVTNLWLKPCCIRDCNRVD